jgi:hypothetical protein
VGQIADFAESACTPPTPIDEICASADIPIMLGKLWGAAEEGGYIKGIEREWELGCEAHNNNPYNNYP